MRRGLAGWLVAYERHLTGKTLYTAVSQRMGRPGRSLAAIAEQIVKDPGPKSSNTR